VLNRNSPEGLAVGWDYLGHWRLEIGEQDGAPLGINLELAGFIKDLAPLARIEMPKAFLGPFSGGVDELGNQLLDWQYAYLWEFTNPEYFAKTRWAVDWPDPWVGDGGTPSADNWGRRLALDLRYVDLLRETRIGRFWMQPSAHYDLSRTFTAPADGSLSTSGVVRKDPSAENQASCFVRILQNSRQVWPAEGWSEVLPNYATPSAYDIPNLPVVAGDKIRFVVKHNGENRADPIIWDPVIVMRGSQATP
jgi:hypothetical protein